jgi:hypothetical protein
MAVLMAAKPKNRNSEIGQAMLKLGVLHGQPQEPKKRLQFQEDPEKQLQVGRKRHVHLRLAEAQTETLESNGPTEALHTWSPQQASLAHRQQSVSLVN